ncbi:GTP-binding protein Rho1, partial [Blyttiomyces sp. JEL0837]
WASEVAYYVQNAPVILVGLKADLRNDPNELQKLASRGAYPVSSQEGQAMANRIGAYAYIECSARYNQNVRAVFETAARATMVKRGGGGGGAGAGGESNGGCCTIL